MTACQAAAENHTSVGCEYYALVPDGISNNPDVMFPDGSRAGSCYAVFIANNSQSAVTVKAELAGNMVDLTKSIYTAEHRDTQLVYSQLAGGVVPPEQVGIVFLSQSEPGDGAGKHVQTACPEGVQVAYTQRDPAVHGTGRGHAFHVTTTSPVVAFDIWPYGGAPSICSSATLLLPTSVWSTNYIAISAFTSQSGALGGGGTWDSNIAFVAAADQTQLTINPVADIVGGSGVEPAKAGVPVTYVLQQGESLQIEQANDLSGSIVMSDKAIGAWGGHWGMQIPAGVAAVDAAHQQIPPITSLGSEYVAVSYRSRDANGEETVPWRIMGVVDGTMLSYEPSAPPDAPTRLDRGQVLEFWSASPFVVKSQDAMFPFYLAAHMTGRANVSSGLGDPETVNVVPPAQYLSKYVFFTDPTYGETNLVLVRAAGGAPVRLDCMQEPLSGWRPIGARYEYTRVDLQTGGAKVGACDNGRHQAQSTGSFGLTVWGWDRAVSYAYPAGATVKPINVVLITPS